ncbi:MAG: HAMP domain-containing histidine kinase [Labilithrix sp.]|nr:HAMP domain-containing histidine kinase [Labilithrix sp.]
MTERRATAAISLPAAKDLRERANRAGERAALAGTPRSRFLREQRRRFASRLLPTLAMLGVATGAAALADLFHDPPVSRWVSLAQGLTATALAGGALGTALARKNIVALVSIAVASSAVMAIGWGSIASFTGGVTSPYALAVPLGVSIMVVALPLPPAIVPMLAALGAAAVAVSCPGAPPLAFVVFALLGGGGYAIARTRRKRALLSFRRVERLAAAVARIRRVQEQLVMVEKLEALRVLVGGMAHELNNALAVSLASTEKIVEIAERDAPGAVRAAHRAQGGLVRIRSTIDRLRRFAMAEAQILEPADVGAMLDFALESAIGRARSGVVIDRRYEEGVGPVECHVSALAEALYQVAKNAIESMPKGGTVRASVRREGDRVVLAVADEGKGIPAARLAKVFDPFYARDTADTFTGARLLPALPGRSGLGLSAVYGLVSAMGGKVEIQSEVGKGTEVSIVLPAR